MNKTPKRAKRQVAAKTARAALSQAEFAEVLTLIENARTRALAAANTALIELYWQVGECISRRVASDGWGQGTVKELAEYIQKRQPSSRGFSASNLWRMMQFFENYRDQPKLATLVRELPLSQNRAILITSTQSRQPRAARLPPPGKEAR